ncbi:MAG: hypothetical protein QGI78_05425 [Phycisphaerales bacterium]|jgi:hypothetical protein|nr:hypothetical protein [Phycisphaerales bacterium]
MITLSTFRGPTSWSILSLAVICLYCIVAMKNSFAPLFEQSVQTSDGSQITSYLEKHDSMVAIDIARFEGRSAFFKPIRKAPPPPPPPPAPVVTTPKEPTPPPPPPIPSTYMGPELIAIIGDEAWFRGTGSGEEAVLRLKAGSEHDGLKVVSTTLPSMVTVEYRRGVYEIDLFIVEEPFFLEDQPAEPETSFLKEVEQEEESPSLL